MFINEFQLSSKKDLRQMLRSDVLPPEIYTEEVGSLQKNLDVFLARQTGTWGTFSSITPEPEISSSLVAARHINWVYPRLDADLGIQFYLPGPGEFERGVFGIEEPLNDPKNYRELSKLSGVLVPGLGFDIFGRRLGRGKGYYDRLLKNWNGIKVGIAFRSQILAELPEEAHDIKMDYLVTSAGVLQCGQQQLYSKVRGS